MIETAAYSEGMPGPGSSPEAIRGVSEVIYICAKPPKAPKKPPPDKKTKCNKFLDKLIELVFRNKHTAAENRGQGTHGLEIRWREMRNGVDGPGGQIYKSHKAHYEQQQQGLREIMDKYNKNDCDDHIDGGRKDEAVKAWKDAEKWVSQPAPTEQEWKERQRQLGRVLYEDRIFFVTKHDMERVRKSILAGGKKTGEFFNGLFWFSVEANKITFYAAGGAVLFIWDNTIGGWVTNH